MTRSAKGASSAAGSAQEVLMDLHPGAIHANLTPAALVELALAGGEGCLTEAGALSALTGKITGRSPKDRYLIPELGRDDDIWWGPVNRPMDSAVFDRLHAKVRAYFKGRELFVSDGAACADPRFHLPVRVIADKAWHAFFAQCLLRPVEAAPFARINVSQEASTPHSANNQDVKLTILVASGLKANPAEDGTRSEVFVVLNLAKHLILIGGTEYAGEIKKSVFSTLNYLLPGRSVLPMHCSANIGPISETALFFGLSGTGKTTLSADPNRRLIGDDEHGWSDAGVFNVEGGCYAKCIRLSLEGEPQIWNALRFGSVLENVVVDPDTRRPDFNDVRYTENTRAAFPVGHIDNAEPSGMGGHPNTVIFLTCDAFGVLPPVSLLDTNQALYHFLSGYTAKVAGTEAGVTEPEATFSTCFASPFLPLHPTRYAEMLQERLARHGSQVWLVNTGWTGGPHGIGKRMSLTYTRAMVRAILDGTLKDYQFRTDPVFNLRTPTNCPGVPSEFLEARTTWSDPMAYDAQARRLAGLFQSNFRAYASQVTEAVRQAGPKS